MLEGIKKFFGNVIITAASWGANIGTGSRVRRTYYGDYFGGVTNLGEAGPVREYFLDHQQLRSRSWQLYLESEQCHMAINRLAVWVVGKGLELRANPETEMLATEGIELDGEAFNESVESRWEVYANSNIGDFAGMRNLHEQANQAFINMLHGGDVLVICRIENGVVKTQIIDGCHVCNPMNLNVGTTGDMYYGENIVRDGVEIDSTGKHVAFHVQYNVYEWKRIEAVNRRTGQLMAWMASMRDFRLDDTRAMAILAPVIETAKVLQRYRQATLGTAEEVAKISLFVRHGIHSSEENPLKGGLAKITNYDAKDDVPTDVQGKQLAAQVYASHGRTAFNLPKDSDIKTVSSEQPLQFKEFHEAVSNDIFSAIGIPPDVARMIYNNSFSASRAALKDWEHTLHVLRARFYRMFYAPIYALWLDMEILKNKIQAPGYIKALMSRDEMVLSAYRCAVFEGANVPHIDPEKEARAEREKLGEAFAGVPLTTTERATRNVNGGDSIDNMEQTAKELQTAKKLKIITEQKPVQVPVNRPQNGA